MPTARDVTVPTKPLHDDRAAGAELVASVSKPELVTVMGFGKDDVLFRTTEANVIQVRDSNGAIAAMLVRLKPGIWGFSRRGDPDWQEVLGIYGSKDQED
jgi:hypothetical protein